MNTTNKAVTDAGKQNSSARVETNIPNNTPLTGKRPAIGRERLIALNGKHYWLQHDGSMRETDWILRDGRAVLTNENAIKSVQRMMQLPLKG